MVKVTGSISRNNDIFPKFHIVDDIVIVIDNASGIPDDGIIVEPVTAVPTEGDYLVVARSINHAFIDSRKTGQLEYKRKNPPFSPCSNNQTV